MRSLHSASKHPLVTERVLELLDTSLKAFHSAIGTGSVADMRDRLRDVLVEVSDIALSELVLFDEEGAVSCTVLVPPPPDKVEVEISIERMRQTFDQLETELLQLEITQPDAETRERLKDVLYPLETQLSSDERVDLPHGDAERLNFLLKKALERSEESILSFLEQLARGGEISFFWLTTAYGDWLSCRKTKEVVSLHGVLASVYEVSPVRRRVVSQRGIIGEPIGRYPVALPFDIEGFGLGRWAENLVIIGKRWPAFGALPQMSGFIVSSFGPMVDFEDELGKRRKHLQLFSWLIFYAAFLFQAYALSQASTEEPRRMRDELSRAGWTRLLKDVPERRETLQDMIKEVLRLDDRFVQRRVLREFAERHPGEAEYLCEKLVELLEPHEGSEQDLLFGALRHLKVFYPAIPESRREQHLETVWSKVAPLLSSPTDSAILDLALLAAEDIYHEAGSTLQVRICDFLIDLVRQSIDEGLLHLRFLESALVAIAYRRDDSRFHQLVGILCDALASLDTGERPPLFECVTRVFATLKQRDRESITNELGKRGKTLHQFVKRLDQVDQNLRQIEQSLKQPSPFAARDDKPELRLAPIVSQKGGVGKTLIALSLASLLAQDHKVCLIELDFFGPTLAHLAGFDSQQESSKVYLNEYFKQHFDWARERGEDLPDIRSKELYDKVKWDTRNPNLKIVPCAIDRQLQDYMLRPILREVATGYIKSELFRLLTHLYDEEYQYVIFDSPAEFKEVALSAASLSLRYAGANIFVSTLFEPAIQPFLGAIPLQYSQGKNCLLVNKIRQLDRQYVEDKTALVDFFGARLDADQVGRDIHSEVLLDLLLKVEYCGPVAWSEKLETFLSTTRRPKPDGFWAIIESEDMRRGLDPVIRFVRGERNIGS